MRLPFEEFVKKHMPITGLAACAARFPDGMIVHHCFNRWLQPAQIRQAMGRLVTGPEILSRHQLDPVRMSWAFEHLRVHLGLRPDRACLALFLENRSELPFAEIDWLLDTFAALPA